MEKLPVVTLQLMLQLVQYLEVSDRLNLASQVSVILLGI